MKKYESLYAKLQTSTDINDMRLAGKVLGEAMEYLSENSPAKAEDLIEELCAINWDNYLTRKEAETIVHGMVPSAKWDKATVLNELQRQGLPTEEMPYYNDNALWTAISMKYSDSADSILRIMGKEKSEVSSPEMLKACYYLALDALKDKDGMFNIRRYFCV